MKFLNVPLKYPIRIFLITLFSFQIVFADSNIGYPCTLYKKEDFDRAKKNIEKYEWAKNVYTGID